MYYLDFRDQMVTPKKERIIQRKLLTSSVRSKWLKKCLTKQNNKCYWCGNSITEKCHLDHIRPIYYGGQTFRQNLVASCIPCNLTKSTDQLIILNTDTINKYLELIETAKRVGFKGGKYFNSHAYAFRKVR